MDEIFSAIAHAIEQKPTDALIALTVFGVIVFWGSVRMVTPLINRRTRDDVNDAEGRAVIERKRADDACDAADKAEALEHGLRLLLHEVHAANIVQGLIPQKLAERIAHALGLADDRTGRRTTDTGGEPATAGAVGLNPDAVTVTGVEEPRPALASVKTIEQRDDDRQ